MESGVTKASGVVWSKQINVTFESSILTASERLNLTMMGKSSVLVIMRIKPENMVFTWESKGIAENKNELVYVVRLLRL